MTDDTRICTDDLIPRLRDAGIAAKLEEWALSNKTIQELQNCLSSWPLSQKNITWEELKQIISDFKNAGLLPTLVVIDDMLPMAIERPAAVGNLGCSVDNIWFGSPDPAVGTFRFYVNGVLKRTLIDHNLCSRAELGVVQGDIVQICKVENGICGWWAKIVAT